VRCIESRALAFQGHAEPRHMEPIQLVKYAEQEFYHFHTDWMTSPSLASLELGGNRVSSFFAYIATSQNLTGGATNFPLLEAPIDERWCKFIDCDLPYDEGVSFLPIEGNAVYWENLLVDGNGDHRTLHAGMPVTSGWKIGMNIWTRQAPLSDAIRGQDV
jgi:prolyl 4-hydroxylase